MIFTIRFDLSKKISIFEAKNSAHYVGGFKSFWVSASKSSEFNARIALNPYKGSDAGQSLPLRANMSVDWPYLIDNACIEVPYDQADEWIEITFSDEGKIDVGSSLNRVEVPNNSTYRIGNAEVNVDGTEIVSLPIPFRFNDSGAVIKSNGKADCFLVDYQNRFSKTASFVFHGSTAGKMFVVPDGHEFHVIGAKLVMREEYVGAPLFRITCKAWKYSDLGVEFGINNGTGLKVFEMYRGPQNFLTGTEENVRFTETTPDNPMNLTFNPWTQGYYGKVVDEGYCLDITAIKSAGTPTAGKGDVVIVGKLVKK